ncbi:GAF and ANTAR domain-containing protein [Streptomyces sp. NPDC050264]|uniref:GAF and ANTAR domain-containing protein n=1 Tax=Streptomyces sp. NPDC050264 TaxID=3155038 RepID=UPI0034266E26
MTDGCLELRLAAALLDAVDTLLDDFDTTHHLRRLADSCVELTGARGAGVFLRRPEGPLPVAQSAEECDCVRELLQRDWPASPARDSLQTGKAVWPVALDSPEAAARWPDFTAAARGTAVTAVCTVPLRRRADVLGALSIVLPELPGTGQGLAIAQTLAEAAAVGLHNQHAYAQYRKLAGQLQGALASRVRIEQAKGMLAERWESTPDAAFTILRQYARSNRVPLIQVAQAVVARALGREEIRPDKSGPA